MAYSPQLSVKETKMYQPRTQNSRVILFAILLIATIFSPCENLHAAESEIPIEGAVYHVHRPDSSHKTYLDIVISHSFNGKLPDDISHITVTGPDGQLPIGKADFSYNPRWRAFWIVRPGFPKIGKYTFEVTGKNGHGSASDTQKVNRTIPVPDISKFKVDPTETTSCPAPVFSWPKIKDAIPLYYQLQLRDIHRGHLFRTDFIRDMTEVRIPPDILKPGMRYQWRIRVADGPDWVEIDNRSQSHWVTKTKSNAETKCEYRYRPPIKVDSEWEISSLGKEGIDPVKITAMMKKLINGDIPNIDSVLIVKNGRLVLEEYLNGYATNTKHDLMSVSKSVTSILIGIARDQGKIDSVDTRLYTFFPSYDGINWEGLKKEIRLKHVLTMSAGLDWNAWGEFRPQMLMVNTILPAILPPAPPRKPVKLDSNILEAYAGDYEFKKLNMPVSIFSEGGDLFFTSPDGEKGALSPETETRFTGTSNEIGDFPLTFFKDKNGKIKHFIVQVGFGNWRFERAE
jgi:hypothetical protein